MAKPVYALVGTDAFLQTQRLREIMAQLPKDAQRIDIDGERAELAVVLDELRSFAMFGGGKVVVVGNGDEFFRRQREKHSDYCELQYVTALLVQRAVCMPTLQRCHHWFVTR